VYLDRDATIAKACDLIAAAGREGARLIVFPEAFIPTYPGWVWHLSPAEAGDMLSALYAELLDQQLAFQVLLPTGCVKLLGRPAPT
jgi:nitrilase